MDSQIRLFQVEKAFTTGPEEARVNYELGAIVEFVDTEEFASAIADGSVIEVTEHVVNDEDIAANPDSGLVLGETIHLPLMKKEEDMTEEEKKAVEDAQKGQAAPAEEAAAAAPVEETVAAPAAPAEKPLVYAGKEVLRDSTREVNGKTYRTVTLYSGETLDVTDEEYAEMLQAAGR